MEVVLKLLGDAPAILGYLVIALSALLSVALLIPGDQPDKALQKVVDFFKSLSNSGK